MTTDSPELAAARRIAQDAIAAFDAARHVASSTNAAWHKATDEWHAAAGSPDQTAAARRCDAATVAWWKAERDLMDARSRMQSAVRAVQRARWT